MPVIAEEEAELLAAINQGIPAGLRDRYDTLTLRSHNDREVLGTDLVSPVPQSKM